MSEIPFRGSLTEDGYLRMARHIWPKMLRATPYLVFVGAAILLWRVWPLSFDRPFRILQVAIVLGIGVAVAMAPRMGARKAWRAEPKLQIEIHGLLNDEGLRWQQEDRGVQLPWSSIIGYRDSDEFLLFYRTPLQFLYVFRSFFEDDQAWRDAVQLTRKHAKPR